MEPPIHSFIIRIWREAVGQQTFIWRGHITHIPDGAQKYLRNLDRDVAAFIAPYLEKMGIGTVRSRLDQGWAALSRLFTSRRKP